MRIGRKIGASVVVLGSLLLALSSAAPALASNGSSTGNSRVTGFRFAATANGASTLFGGWVFQPAAAAKSVTVEFKIPALKCKSATTGVSPSTVMLTGSSSAPKASVASVLQVCSGGKTVLIPAVTVNNTETNGPETVLHTGDLMQATVVTSSTKTTATIADLTKGHTYKLTKSGKGAASVQEFIASGAVDSGTTQLPVANFGKISYSNGAVGGKAIGTVTPSEAVNMVSSAKVLQISTGTITGSGKNAFTTTWKHS